MLRNRASGTFGLPKTLHAFGVNLFLLPLGIATSVLIARSVGPTGKGTLDLIVATSALLAMVLGLSLPQGITYVVAQGKVVHQGVGITIGSCVNHSGFARTGDRQSSKIYWLRADVLARLGIVDRRWGSALCLVGNNQQILGGILAGQQQIAVVNNAELIGRVAQFTSLFILAGGLYFFGNQLSVGLLFLVTLSASVLISLILVTSLGFKFELSRDLSGLKGAFGFALPCYAANTAQFLNYRLDVFVVGFFAGTTSVGRYTLAVSLAQLLWLMSNSVASVLLPKVAAATDVGDSVRHTTRVTRLSLWATAFGALALALVATQAIPLLYGEAFRPSVLALFWLLPGVVLFSIVNVLAAYIAGIGKPHLNLWVSGTSLIITIGLDLALIPRLSIVGASIASTVSYSFSALLLVVFFNRETGASLRQVLLPTSEDLRMLLSVVRPRLSSEGTV